MSVDKQDYIVFQGKHLGTVDFKPQHFPNEIYQQIDAPSFKELTIFEKHEVINRSLYQAIEKSEGEVFLLPKVVSFITRVKGVLPGYQLTSFELWLIHFSGIGEEEQRIIRGKIVGKTLPRWVFQTFFPLGTGMPHKGSHYSLAHYSPDLDTTVASFHCFMAAFGSKLASSLHYWSIPGGPPKGSVEIEFLFKKALGEGVFQAISRSDKEVEITSLDLLSQDNIEKRELADLYYDIDPARARKATILIDDQGCYLGDWRQVDVDPVHGILNRFWGMLNAHQNAFQIGLASLFAKKLLRREDLRSFAQGILGKKFSDCNSSIDLTVDHRRGLDKFLKEVVGVRNGYSCSYNELLTVLEKKFGFKSELISLDQRPFFNNDGSIIEDRGRIFTELEKMLVEGKATANKLQRHFETLEIALKIKREVLGHEPNYLSYLADLDQIQKQMRDYSHLTVNYQEGDHLYPLGVIYAADLNRKPLATSSWNDFSNPSETYSQPEIDVISFVDHHRSEVKTARPAMGIVMDAQSSNSIYANLLFDINDQYSSGGMSSEQIEKQIEEVSKDLIFPSRLRVLRRLLKRKDVLMQNHSTNYYVSRDREFLEYLQSLYAILDDTDLLTKVTPYDLDAVSSLINRLKSLMLMQEVEVVNFDDLDRSDSHFVKTAAKRLLQSEELYSLYGIIYKAKEEAIEKVISDTLKGYDATFFQDTKILSGYASVGQFKHFVNNAQTLKKADHDLKKIWITHAKASHKENPDLKLYLFMLSTISSAKELFTDAQEANTYQDELWIWCPEECDASEAHLNRFIAAFTESPLMENEPLEIHFYGESKPLEKLCRNTISRPFETVRHKGDNPLLVLKVPQKKINSRKAQIAPHL